MAFSFGFSGDDIDVDVDDDAQGSNISNAAGGHAGATAAEDHVETSVPVRDWDIRELLKTLPDRISYSTVRIESPTGRVIHLPRRELYDVRVQLMAEDDDRRANEEILSDIDKSDIRTGVYEGGFKTWECSVDLACLLLDRGPRKDIDELIRCDQIVELGAGSALPSLVLFQHALKNDIPLTFTFSDFNDSVLRLITLPNLLLTWAAFTHNPLIDTSNDSGSGDLELNESVLKRFCSDLNNKNVNLKLVSGPWSAKLAELIPSSAPDMGSLILGAETIYSPASTSAFVNLLDILLRRVKMAKAMIGAKRVYFGVGGSVDGLKEACREKGAVAYEIENHGVPGMDVGGVGRALIEVQMY